MNGLDRDADVSGGCRHDRAAWNAVTIPTPRYSAHFTVADDGVAFDGVCTLRSTARRPAGSSSVEPLLDPADGSGSNRVRTDLDGRSPNAPAPDGYRGYLGIDAAAKGFSRVDRPVRDVNARWTMGRVAMTLGERTRIEPVIAEAQPRGLPPALGALRSANAAIRSGPSSFSLPGTFKSNN